MGRSFDGISLCCALVDCSIKDGNRILKTAVHCHVDRNSNPSRAEAAALMRSPIKVKLSSLSPDSIRLSTKSSGIRRRASADRQMFICTAAGWASIVWISWCKVSRWESPSPTRNAARLSREFQCTEYNEWRKKNDVQIQLVVALVWELSYLPFPSFLRHFSPVPNRLPPAIFRQHYCSVLFTLSIPFYPYKTVV